MIQLFYLCCLEDGRVVLSDQMEGIGFTPVPAQAKSGMSAWQVCRERVDMHGLQHRPGYGWYRSCGR